MATKKSEIVSVSSALKLSGERGQLDPDVIGARLKRMRLRQGLSTRELAKQAGVGRNTVMRVEEGSPTTVPTLNRICSALGLTLSWLFSEEPSDEVLTVHKRKNESWWVYNFEEGQKQPKLIEVPRSKVAVRSSFVEEGKETLLSLLDCRLEDGQINAWLLELYGVRRSYHHSGEELLFCLKGSVKLKVGNREVVLEKGDAACFWASEEHSYQPAGDKKPALILSVCVVPAEKPFSELMRS